MKDPRLEKLAQVLVHYSTAVKPGELVVIGSGAPAEPLIRELWREIIKAGGHPHLRLGLSGLNEIFYACASEEQLDFVSPLAKYEIETFDKRIGIGAPENTRSMTNVDPAKQARVTKAHKPIFDRTMERTAKGDYSWVATMYPTNAAAQDAEMSLANFEDFVFGAGLLDRDDPVAAWKEVSAKQQKIVDYLNTAKKVHLEAANGTDLTFSVEGRKWINCDGRINFPDGEIYTGPVEDSINGTVAFSFPGIMGGREVDGIRMTYEKGRVVRATAQKGEEFLLKMLDQDQGARGMGEFAIGVNYGIQRFIRNTLFDEKIGGTIHIAVGAGYPETGSVNKSGLHWDMVCDLRPGGRLTVDGKPLMENGKLVGFEI